MNYLRNFGLYLVHTVIASAGVLSVCALLDAGLYFLSGRIADVVFSESIYPGEITVGLLVGFAVNHLRFLHSKSAKWAWFVPSLPIFYDFCCCAHLVGWNFELHYLFLARCNNCIEQLLTMAPFYSSIAYSLGAWAALKRFAPSKTFTTEG